MLPLLLAATLLGQGNPYTVETAVFSAANPYTVETAVLPDPSPGPKTIEDLRPEDFHVTPAVAPIAAPVYLQPQPVYTYPAPHYGYQAGVVCGPFGCQPVSNPPIMMHRYGLFGLRRR